MNAPTNLGVSNLDDESTVLPAPMNVPISAPPPKKAATNRLAPYKKRIWIVLEDNDDIPPTGQFFGHNGVGFMLRPGLPVEVPSEIVDILNNAEYLAPQVDPQTRQIIGYRPRLRFPYRIVPAPDREAA